MLAEEDVPPDLADGWEIYSAIQSGIVKPLTLEQWDQLPDPVVRQLLIIMEITPQVAKVQSEMKVK